MVFYTNGQKVAEKCVAFAVAMAISCLSIADNSTREEHHNYEMNFPLSVVNDGIGQRPSLSEPMSFRSAEAPENLINPLETASSIVFPDSVNTIGQAVEMVLRPVGYKLVTSGAGVSPLLPTLLNAILPSSQRSLQHLRAREMLRALSGVGYVAVFDHVNRRVTFDPRPLYARLGKEPINKSKTFVPVSELSKDRKDVSVQAKPSISAPIVRSDDTLSFADQVALLKNKRSATTVLRNNAANNLLSRNTEISLRALAEQFDPMIHTVRISNCTSKVSDGIGVRHQKLIVSSLERLGMKKNYHEHGSCNVKHESGDESRNTVFVVVLDTVQEEV